MVSVVALGSGVGVAAEASVAVGKVGEAGGVVEDGGTAGDVAATVGADSGAEGVSVGTTSGIAVAGVTRCERHDQQQ